MLASRLPKRRLMSRPLFAAATTAVLVACSEMVSSPVVPELSGPDVQPTFSFYPDAGVLTSTGDTCPGYIIPAELAEVFWHGTDEEIVSNPDSVYAADSIKVADPSYREPLMLVDPSTGAELFAGPCEVAWNRCEDRCRAIQPWRKRARALCWGGCAARYALCKRREREREQDGEGCQSTQLAVVYDPYAPPDQMEPTRSCGSDGGGELGCRQEWMIIEFNDGTGWRPWWQGWVTVCQ
jgi:hypothetical protein